MNKELDKFKTKVNRILAEYRGKDAELWAKITETEEARARAREAAATAYAAGDEKAYHLAKEKERQHSDSISFYTQKMTEHSADPAIDSGQYSDLLAECMAILAESVRSDTAKIVSLMDKIIQIGEENEQTIREGNEILRTLQHDLAGDDACYTCQNGKKIHMDSLERRFSDYSVAALKNTVKTSFFYTQAKKAAEHGKAE